MVENILAILALFVSIFSLFQVKRRQNAEVLATQRLVWAENLRSAVKNFAFAMYEGKDLEPYRLGVFIYLTPRNVDHMPLIKAIDELCKKEDKYIESDYRTLLSEAQKVLHGNWLMVKSELTLWEHEERQRDKRYKALKYERSVD